MNAIEVLKARIDVHPQFSWEKRLSLQRGDFLKMPGTTNSNLYFVTAGCLRAFLENEDGEQTIRFGYTGNFFTAIDSFISDAASQMALQALRKSEVLAISKPVFLNFIEADIPTAAASHWPGGSLTNKAIWLQLLSQLIFGQIEREIDLLTSSPAARYQRVLKRSPHLFQLVPAKYIANYLRMSPETLSRLRKP